MEQKTTFIKTQICIINTKRISEISIRCNLSVTKCRIRNFVSSERLHWASKLREFYEAGKLKGKLKEVAAKLKEDDNDVVVIYKLKQK